MIPITNNQYISIGLISGTSADGIDVSIILSDGVKTIHRIGGDTYEYSDSVQQSIIDLSILLQDGKKIDTKIIRQIDESITYEYYKAINSEIIKHKLAANKISMIGLHGQTLIHKPDQGYSLQIGNGKLLADLLNITVVDQFRLADLAAGGQGAPLTPCYHQMIVKQPNTMVLNLGGVANVTFLGQKQNNNNTEPDIIAFDCGPANAYIDDLVRNKLALPFDNQGKIAASGQASAEIINKFLSNDYFNKPPPKSLDRNHFRWLLNDVEALSVQDALATLTEASAQSVLHALRFASSKPKVCFVVGGGSHNTFMMNRLATLLQIPVQSIEVLGIDPNLIEAEAFAVLAIKRIIGAAGSFSSTTGVPKPCVLGNIHFPLSFASQA